MDVGYSKRILGALAGLLLFCIHDAALAVDYCAIPGEQTDPQALHINGAKSSVYKTIGNTDLRLHVFSSAGRKAGVKSPAVVFFYGGGFILGDVRRFQTEATHLALRGMVTILVDYRVQCRNPSTTIMDEIADVKSAMRWVRGHADELSIDPSRIAAVGSSAGGVLALDAALISDFDDPTDNKKIDPRPNALILYNPGTDTGTKFAHDFMAKIVGNVSADRGLEYSPFHHLERGLPPTIIFQGDADPLYPDSQKFCARARDLKFQCDLVTYPGAPHGFTEIWIGLEKPERAPNVERWAEDTSRRADDFLTRLGWMPVGWPSVAPK
jgi:acetyl esterase/lipase